MPVLEKYQALITAVDGTAPGVAQARKTIAEGLKGAGVPQSGAEAEKAAGSWGRFGKTVGELPGHLKVLYHTGGMGRAVDEMKEMRQATDEAGASLRAFVPATAALTALGSAAGMGELLRNFASYGVALRNTAAPLGIATQDLERWQHYAELSGVSTDAVASSFGNLNAKITAAAYGTDAGTVALFNYFKIAARNANGSLRSVEQTTKDVFAAFKANEGDPRAQARLLEAFGLGDLDPLFRKAKDLTDLTAQMKEAAMHGVLSPEMEGRAVAMHEAFTGLNQSVSGFGHAISADLEPTFAPLMKTVGQWLDQNRESKAVMDAVKASAEVLVGVIGLTLVGAIGKAAKAVISFNAAWLASPLGLLALGVGGIVGLYEGRDAMAERFPLPGRPGSRGRVGAPRTEGPDIGGWFSHLFGGQGAPGAPRGPNLGRGLRVPGTAGVTPGEGFFNSVAQAEGTFANGAINYDKAYGGQATPKPLTQMSIAEAIAWAKGTAGNPAMGGFQEKSGTIGDAIAALRIPDTQMFDAATQRRVATWTAGKQGLDAWTGFAAHPDLRKTAADALAAGVTGGGMGTSGGTIHGALDDMVKLAGPLGPDLRKYLTDPQGVLQRDPALGRFCAEFANAYLQHAGVPGTGSLMANSFSGANWPVVANPRPGDILTSHLDEPGNAHVGVMAGDARRNAQGVLEYPEMSSHSRETGLPGIDWRTDVQGRRSPALAAAQEADFADAAAARDSHHSVDVNFLNAPEGMSPGVRMAVGPANFGMRVEHAMAPTL